jgi:hypothetical protein
VSGSYSGRVCAFPTAGYRSRISLDLSATAARRSPRWSIASAVGPDEARGTGSRSGHATDKCGLRVSLRARGCQTREPVRHLLVDQLQRADLVTEGWHVQIVARQPAQPLYSSVGPRTPWRRMWRATHYGSGTSTSDGPRGQPMRLLDRIDRSRACPVRVPTCCR